MKKILVFSTNYLPFIGGAELAISNIAGNLPDTEFHLITPRYTRALPKEETIGRVRVYRVGFGFFLDKFLIPFAGFFKGLSIHRREKFGIVWSMMASHASISAAFFKIVKRRVPLVLTLQEGDEEEYLKRYTFGNETLYKLFIKPWHTLVFKVADSITVISTHLEARARRNNRSVPIVLVPNGVDLTLFDVASKPDIRTHARRDFGFTDSDSVVVTVSRLVEKNRVDTLIRAIAALPVSYKLLIAGAGKLEADLKSLAEELEISSRVTFVGRVEPNDIPRILSTADVFARPSASEGFGSAFLEAMAARVPVIATPVGGIVDFLIDKETGLFCAVDDADDVARKITVLTRDHILRAEIIEKAFKMVSEKYDWSAVGLAMQTSVFRPLFHLRRERILIATGIFPPEVGGPATYAKALHNAFWGRGFATDVVTYGWEKKSPTGLRHVVLFLRLVFPVLSSDWVIGLDTFSSGLPALLVSKLLRRKILIRTGGDFLWEQYVERTKNLMPLPDFYAHMPQLSFKERFIFKLTRFVLRKVDMVVFSTEWQRSLWEKPYGLLRSKTALVENFYGEKEQSVLPSRKNIIFTGRPITIKNLSLLKRSFASFAEKHSEFSLEHLAVSHRQLMNRLRDAYAIVVPSLSEISPNFVLEAIRFDCPFILTKHNGLHQRIGKLGVFIDPGSERSIEKGLLELANPARYTELKKHLSEFSFTHSWDDIASEFISVFESLR